VEAALEGARKAGATVAKGAVGVIGDVVFNIEVGITNFAMQQLEDLRSRIQRQRLQADKVEKARNEAEFEQLVDRAYQKGFDSVEHSVRYNVKDRTLNFMDLAKRAYRAGILGSENVLRGLPKDLLDNIYIRLEPTIREHATKVTTVEVYHKWGEQRVRESIQNLLKLCIFRGSER
jgi:hypothetical protein